MKHGAGRRDDGIIDREWQLGVRCQEKGKGKRREAMAHLALKRGKQTRSHPPLAVHKIGNINKNNL